MKMIPQSVSRNIGRKVLVFKKNSPHIFFVVGVAGVVGSTVLACRATLKLNWQMQDFSHDIEGVKALKETNEKNPSYSGNLTKDYNRDMAYVYSKGLFNLGRLYGPSVAVGACSIGLLTSSHVILTRRNNALTATLVLVTKAYEDYRTRVREDVGEKREFDLYHGLANKEIVSEDGKKEIIKVADPNRWSPYARFFDEGSPNWSKTSEYNRLFVQCQQNYMNNLLQSRGHVFLNEVYDSLGIERSQAGQVVGWLLNNGGDNFVDFNMFSVYNRDFVNGQERSILLDFNVDGVIYDKL